MKGSGMRDEGEGTGGGGEENGVDGNGDKEE